MDIEQEQADQQFAVEENTELQEGTGRNSVVSNEFSEKKWRQCIFPGIQCGLTILKLDLSRQQWAQGEFTLFCGGLAQMNNLTSIDLDLSHNFIEDAGSVLLSSSLSKLSQLTNISLDLQRNYLQRNAFSVLLTLNSLTNLSGISLDLRGNTLDLEAELPSLLPQFHNPNVFSKITSFNLMIDDVKVAPEVKPSPSQVHLEEKIRSLSAQLQQLIQASRQYAQFPSHLVQFEQQAQQINLQIANAKTQLQQELKSNKKSGACRLFEIMLKFTTNLQIFGFSFPGQLIGSREWEFLGGLLRNKSQSLQQLKLEGLNVNFQCAEMGYAFYQIGKLSNLTSLSLSLHNLTANSELSLTRFLKNLPKLKSLTLDFSSMDALTPQTEITKDIASFAASQTNLKHLSLSLAHASIDDETSHTLFTAISQLNSLSSIQLSLKECKAITHTTIIALCNFLNSCKFLHAISIDLSGANLQPSSIVSFLASLATTKAQTLLSLVFNFLSSNSRRQPFSQQESEQINLTLSSFQNLKKCIITMPNNPLLATFKEKAAQKNKLINACLLAKYSRTFHVIRKDFAFQVLDFLI